MIFFRLRVPLNSLSPRPVESVGRLASSPPGSRGGCRGGLLTADPLLGARIRAGRTVDSVLAASAATEDSEDGGVGSRRREGWRRDEGEPSNIPGIS
jgi:hypothetical protein